jgi:hypothetical protein
MFDELSELVTADESPGVDGWDNMKLNIEHAQAETDNTFSNEKLY